jgi:uncharacterized protein (DUF1800 family)
MRNDTGVRWVARRSGGRKPFGLLPLGLLSLAGILAAGGASGQLMPALPPPAPEVSALTPSSGPAFGGTRVAVTGYRMQSGATLKIGADFATGLSYTSAAQIGATMPPASAGIVNDILLTNPDSSTATLAGGWFANYNDVPQSYLFHDAIEKITRKGITTGCGSGNYCPNNLVTRGEMAVFLLRSKHGASYSPPTATGTKFTDVTTGTPFAPWIEQLAAEGITTGCGGGKYCPTQNVTRDAMAVFLLRTEHGSSFVPPPPVGIFTDVPTTLLFANWIEQLANEGVTGGCNPGMYCPASSVTRGQMAVFLSKTFNGDILRLLEQATWGPTEYLIYRVRTVGIPGWLNAQFTTPSTGYPTLALWPSTVPIDCNSSCQRDNYSMYLLQRRFFTNAMTGTDQLRQRVSWALHRMLVVSGNDLNQPSWMTPYLQILDRNAFGNFRQLLSEITLNPAMGRYLDMITSTRSNPNENYAREILQLFSIGLEKFNPDGTVQTDGDDQAIPTYDQDTVTGFARVFTGWKSAARPSPDVPNYLDPMVLQASNHETGAKQLLNGIVLPSGQSAVQDLNDALDNIFNHTNVGPFVSFHLIRALVTSNPSPAYVGRVAAAFDNNGAGVRGDLKAVVQAILLDPEARGDSKPDLTYGRLKEPVQFVNQILRAFNARSANGAAASDGYLNPQTSNMGQDVWKPASVFSYYPSDFLVPGTTDLSGPEFGILSATTALRRANFVNTMAFGSIGTSTNAPNGTSLDLSKLQALAGSPEALVTELNRSLMHGAMSGEMKAAIVTAVTAVSSSNTLQRAQQALYLVATSSQFQVQR